MGVSTYGKFNKVFHNVKTGSDYPLPQAVQGFQAVFDGQNGITFSYTSARKAAKVQYSLDSGAWIDAPLDGRLPVVANGLRSLRLRGLNGIGQAGPETNAVSVSINPAPLAVTDFAVTKLGAGIMGYTFTPAVGSVRTEYSLDGGPWTVTTLPQSLPGLSTGVHTLRLRGVNSVNVPGPETATQMLRVYALPVMATSITLTQLTLTSLKLVIGLPANATTVEYSLNNGPWLPAGTTTTINGVGSGLNGVRVRGINQDGDIGPVAGPVTIDIAPSPATVFDLRLGDKYQTQFSFLYTAPSSATTMQYSLNGGTWTTFDKPFIYNLTPGSYNLQIRGVNRDGFPGAASNTEIVTIPVPVAPITNFSIVSKASRSFVIDYTLPAQATTVQYSINSGAYMNMPANKTISVAEPGTYVLLLRAVLSNGSYGTVSDPISVTLVPTYVYNSLSQRKVTADPNISAQQNLGYGVAVSGDGSTSVATAPFEGKGYVYVFATTPTVPTRTARFTTTEAVTQFGRSVALSADGQTMVLGSVNSKIFVYTRSGDNWNPLQVIENASDGSFGTWSINISDDGKMIIVPGANAIYSFNKSGGTYTASGNMPKFSTENNNEPTGSPLVMNADGTSCAILADSGYSIDHFDWSSNTWARRTKMFLPFAATNVTMSSNGLYIAATSYDIFHTIVFSRPSTSSIAWNQEGYLKRYTAVTRPGNGSAISLSANGDVIWATSNASQMPAPSDVYGYGVVYTRSGSTWSFANEANVPDRFGYHSQMARGGGLMVTGADLATNNGFINSGALLIHRPSIA